MEIVKEALPGIIFEREGSKAVEFKI